jgi:amino acid transporter
MAQQYGRLKKKPVGKMIGYGIASVLLYAALFLNQGTITALFTRGSWYALFPIATAFAISFIHGGFTGYFWSVLGIEATKKALRTRTEEKHTYDTERPQPQPRLRARV